MLDQVADQVLAMMARSVSGRLTAAEALRHDEFVLTKLYRSTLRKEGDADRRC